MKKKYYPGLLVLLVLLSLPICSNAQSSKDSISLESKDSKLSWSDDPEFSETIITDRPDQTEAPSLTPKGWFQIETGAQSETDKSYGITTQSSLYNTTLWKYGLSKNLELRVITEFAADKVKNDTSELLNQDGFNPITVGSKIRICEGHKWIPQISLITHLTLPYLGSENYKPNYIIPRYRFLFSHGLSEKLNLSYNLGMEWEDGTSAATSIYTLSLAYAALSKLGFFIETYGFIKENQEPDHRLDGGLTLLLTNNLQYDISAGVGLGAISPDYFISTGLSFRFNAFDKARRNN